MEQNQQLLQRATQRALLGAVGPAVLAVAVAQHGGTIDLTAFTTPRPSAEQREALEVAGTEIVADLPDVDTMNVRIIEDAYPPFRAPGSWVFVQLGCHVS